MEERITRIFLVRHGLTEWNATRRAQGQADVALNDEGRAEALVAAERLAHLEVVAVYSSDLERALDTARPIAAHHGLEVEVDPALREIDQGEWTGLHVDEIARRWPGSWGDARHHTARPGGESPGEVRVRALEALARIVAAHPRGTVVVVSHGGTIRWISAEALALDERGSARIPGLANGAVVAIDAELVDGRLALGNYTRLDRDATIADDPNN